MRRPGAIEHGRGTGDEGLAELGLVQIAAEDENREHRPVVRVLRHAGAAPIDDSSDRGAAEFLQHLIPRRGGRAKRLSIRSAAPAVKLWAPPAEDAADLETVQY